jgi:predicted MFS family arabinose efflux permease
MLPALAEHFRRTPGEVSQLISISTVAVALAAPLIGLLGDRWGRKRMIAASALLLAVPTLLAATSTSFGQLLFWRFFVGLFTPGVFALTVTYINEEWTHGAGRAMGAYVCGTVSGGFVGRMLAAFVAGHGDWRMAFVALGILNALGGVAIWRLMPVEQHATRARRGLVRTMIAHLKNPRLLATYVAGFCVLFSLLGVFTYVNFLLAASPFHLNAEQLGWVFMVYLAGAAAMPGFGRVIDRLGQRLAFVVGMAVAFVGVLLTLIPSVAAVVVGLALFCMGIFAGQSSASSYIGRAATGAKAAAVGLYVTAYYVGGTFGAAVPGVFWSRFGWTGCVALIALIELLTAAIALRYWRDEEEPAEPAERVLESVGGAA